MAAPPFKYLSDEEMPIRMSALGRLAKSMVLCLRHGIGPVDKLKLVYLYFCLQLRVRLGLSPFLPFRASVRSASGKTARLYFSEPENFWAFDEIFTLEIYLPRTRAKPLAIFDLGANVGYASSYFASCFPDAKIYAIEPSQKNFAALKKNCSSLPNVKCFKLGIGAKDGKATLYLAPVGHAHSLAKMPGSVGSEEVEVLALDDFATGQKAQPQLIKCDTEGAEFPIFGSSSCWKKCNELMGEVHKSAGSPEKFASLLRKAGFAVQLEHRESASPFFYAQKKPNKNASFKR